MIVSCASCFLYKKMAQSLGQKYAPLYAKMHTMVDISLFVESVSTIFLWKNK